MTVLRSRPVVMQTIQFLATVGFLIVMIHALNTTAQIQASVGANMSTTPSQSVQLDDADCRAAILITDCSVR